jgi:hypothetical protein
MKSRGTRLVLLFLFLVALGATAYLFWRGESLARSEYAALKSFEDKAREASRAMFAARGAQQAYVAAGQPGEFWPGRFASGMDGVRAMLASLRAEAASGAAAGEIDSALAALDDYIQLDRRVRRYTATGQQLLASDLIFGDGLGMASALDARIQAARSAEIGAREAAITTLRNRQAFALAAAAAAATLVVLLLLPQGEPEHRTVVSVIAATPEPLPEHDTPAAPEPEEAALDDWSPPKKLSVVPRPETAPPLAPATPPAEPAVPEPIAAHTDFSGVALLCTDLARVIDTHQLPSLLDRASTLLDAKGIILWIADADGRELNPIVAHGYTPQLVDRLGTIPREAENATAAAFRTELLQTVRGEGASNGAIAAPLVTPGGCVGVMAAEVRNEGEREEGRLAAAAIVAAQLATLVGPPTRPEARSEVAGA